MNFKKFISGVSALTIAASAFAGMAVTANAEDETKNYSPTVDTYVNYNDQETSYGSATELKTGYNKISNNSIAMANTGWGANYITYMKFDLSELKSETRTITSADLSFYANASGRGHSYSVYGIANENWDGTLTYTAATKAVTGQIGAAQTVAQNNWKTVTYNILDYLNNDADGVLAIAIIDTAAGSGTIYSSENSDTEHRPKITVNLTDIQPVSVTLSETNNLSPAITIDNKAATSPVSLLPGDHTIKATLTGYHDYDATFNVPNDLVNGAYSYTMVAKDSAGAITVKYIDSDTDTVLVTPSNQPSGTYEGDTATIHYPAYIYNGGKYYECSESAFGETVTYTNSPQTKNINYTEVTDKDIVLYAEAETAMTLSNGKYSDANTALSGGYAVSKKNTDATTATIDVEISRDGEYVFNVPMINQNGNTRRTYVTITNKATNEALVNGEEYSLTNNGTTGTYTKTLDLTAGTYEVKLVNDTAATGAWANPDYLLVYSPKYAVKPVDAENGSVSVADSAVKGEAVTITATPYNGYAVDTITVTADTTGDEIEVTNNSFTMPADDVTVSVTFKAVTPEGPTAEVTGISYQQFAAEDTDAKSDADVTAAKVYVHITGTAQSLSLEYDGNAKPVKNFEGLTDANILLGAIIPGLVDLELSSFTAVAN